MNPFMYFPDWLINTFEIASVFRKEFSYWANLEIILKSWATKYIDEEWIKFTVENYESRNDEEWLYWSTHIKRIFLNIF